MRVLCFALVVTFQERTEDGLLSTESYGRFDPRGLDRMDYFISQLKKQGDRVEFSNHFGTPPPGPQDRAIVPSPEEFGALSPRSSDMTPATTS